MEYIALNDICDVRDGTHDSPKYVQDGFPLVTSKNIVDGKLDLSTVSYLSQEDYDKINERSKVDEGDIIMPMIGTIGNPLLIEDFCEFAIKNVALIKFPNKEISNKYIWYFLKSGAFKKYVAEKNKGGTQKFLSLGDIRSMKVPNIGYSEQISVVERLDAVYKVIEQRCEELSLLDDLIKARFVEFFGNPLDKSMANKYFVECVDFNPKKSEVKDMMDETVSFVPMECVGVDGSFTIREDGLVRDYYKGYTYFRDGDVLLAKITPCFENGKVAIAENCTNGIGFGTTEFHVFRPIAGVSNSYWIKYMLKNDSVHDLATINMTGSAGQKRIQTPFFEKLKIYLPPIELQNQFADFIHQVDKSKVAVQKSLDETQQLFDSLMQRYFG